MAATMTFGTTGDVPVIDLEASLVRAAIRGDERAFERLYRRHVARIHSLVRRMVGMDAADDLVQDIFVRAWDKLASFRGDAQFGTWLHRLAVNVVLSNRRRVKTERAWFSDEAPADDVIGARHVSPGVSMDLDAAISRLPEGARQVFLLHDVEGWTHEEIAERMGLVPGTSKSQLSRARAALRRMLDGY